MPRRLLEAGPAIRLSLLSGLVFYSIVAMVVMAGSARLGVRPVISSGHALTGAAEGAVVGAGAAIILVAVAFVVTGHPVLDPVAAAITNQSVAAFVVGALLIAGWRRWWRSWCSGASWPKRYGPGGSGPPWW
ncbi:MAG: hypothetical protein ACR2GF_04945 [Acidimicrobiales bacterium]